MDDMKILIVGSDRAYTSAITRALSKIQCNTNYCTSIEKAVNELSNDSYDFIITDYSTLNKEYSIRSFIEAYSRTELIIATYYPSYSEGSMAIRDGARDYVDLGSEISVLPSRLTAFYTEKSNKERLRENLLKSYLLDSKSNSFNKMLSYCEKVANTKANILIIGESGTGKEVAANYIHLCSQRSTESFVPVNCSAFTETLLESELFGYEQGAFTGATKAKQGRFEFANRGTLFLDEVGDINKTTQVKLLRVLETKKVERLGSNMERLIDFRLISATNKDMVNMVLNNSFREDFFYRISTIVIRVPPLRERPEDLDALINFLLIKAQDENNIKINCIEPEAQEFLHNYDYPGNIRELKNIIDRMVILSVDGAITKDGIPILSNIHRGYVTAGSQEDTFDKIIPFRDFKRESESRYIQWVLSKTESNVAEAARKLELSSRQLFNKINEYGIKK